jgi:hypothetical protein
MKEQEVINYPGPFSVGPRIIRDIVCPDGSKRSFYASPLGPDTFFSIPGKVYAKGKTITGYATVESTDEWDRDTNDFVTYWKFIPYTYSANWKVVS